jgi:hypothetical protein
MRLTPEDVLRRARENSMKSPFLSIHQLAAMAGVTVRTLRRWHAAGGGPNREKRGRRLMYHIYDVEAWLDKP